MGLATYIGIPFVVGGRTPDGWDCWGCVQWIARHEFGIEMPDFPLCARAGALDMQQVAHHMDTGRVHFKRVDAPVPGCVVLLYRRRFPAHAGLMVNDHEFIHAQQPVGTVIASLRDREWRGHAEGFYVHD